MTVRSEMHGRVGVWTLSRPDALNALDTATLEALCAAAAAAGANPDVRAVVLTGEGRAFAAGADISEMQGKSALDMERFRRLGPYPDRTAAGVIRISTTEFAQCLNQRGAPEKGSYRLVVNGGEVA